MFTIFIRIFIFLVFFLSGTTKLLNSEGAEKLINISFNFPYNNLITKYFIMILSILELLLSFQILIFNKKKNWIFALGLILIFSFFLVCVSLFEIKIPYCGCFGSLLPENSILLTIMRNIILIVLITIYLQKMNNK
ncbi:MAG: hypothetical protein IPM32_09150 [Ignavibacteriae bacterium]|nr:hypothetical protein [Ignavibacteriota bacterium]